MHLLSQKTRYRKPRLGGKAHQMMALTSRPKNSISNLLNDMPSFKSNQASFIQEELGQDSISTSQFRKTSFKFNNLKQASQ